MLYISCIATGFPAPNVVWQKINFNSRYTLRNTTTVTGKGNLTRVSVTLQVFSTRRSDTGMYRCSASNIISTAIRNITVIVQCKRSKLCIHIHMFISFKLDACQPIFGVCLVS